MPIMDKIKKYVMHAAKSGIRYICDRLRRRPICAICMILVAITWLYVISPVYWWGQAEYKSGCDNPLKAHGISNGDEIRLTGRVASLNLKEVNGQMILSAGIKNVRLSEGSENPNSHARISEGVEITPVKMQILASFSSDEQLKIGQWVDFVGELSYFAEATNPGEFNAYEYYGNTGVLFQVYNAKVIGRGVGYNAIAQKLYELRLEGEAMLANWLGIEDAAIMKAMIFGNKNEITSDVKESFRKNGIAHILAISGLHISFLAMGLYMLLIRAGAGIRIAALISEVTIILYGIMVGFPISAFRAICMFSIFLAAKLFLRSYDLLTAMSVSLTLVLVFNPIRIMDSGLKLSYMAVMGVGFFYNSFRKNVWKAPKWLDPVFISLFVFLSTLPILLSAYYEIAVYSIVLNPIIIPLMSVLLVATIGIILLGGISFCGWIVQGLTYVVSTILGVYKGLCSFLSENGAGRFNVGSPDIWQIIIFYGLLIIAVYIRKKKKTGCQMAVVRMVFCVAMGIWVLFYRPYSGLNVWMLDVGQGDCMVIQNESGHTYIIDGGSSSRKRIGERVLIPMLKYYGVNQIEAVFITHPDEDHMNGIRELVEAQREECLLIRNIYVYEGFFGDGDIASIANTAASYETTVIGLHKGQVISDGRLNISVLYPKSGHGIDNSNNASLVMKVNYGGFCMITTGDVETEGESEVASSYVDNEGVDVL